jgi:hypothetical protein
MIYIFMFFSYLVCSENYHHSFDMMSVNKSLELIEKKKAMERIIDIYSSGIAQFLNPNDLVIMLKNDKNNNFTDAEIIKIKTVIIKRRECEANLHDIF